VPKILQSVNGDTTTLYESGTRSVSLVDVLVMHCALSSVYARRISDWFRRQCAGESGLAGGAQLHLQPHQYEGRRIVGFEVEPESITHTVDFDPKDPKQVTKSVQFTAPVSLTYCAVSVDLFETRHWPTSC
jgi:hypothetical protein